MPTKIKPGVGHCAFVPIDVLVDTSIPALSARAYSILSYFRGRNDGRYATD
jgi:hypothetical protein